MEYLPESTRLLYSQLLGTLLASARPPSRGLGFVSKKIRGGKHWYLQVSVGGRKTQHYVGPDTAGTRALIDRQKAAWDAARSGVEDREDLVAMLVAGKAHAFGSAEARVLELLESAGVFAAGGVLVGSHAFGIYGNMLGVRWPVELTRTEDLDIAGDVHLEIGVPHRAVPLRKVLLESGLGFVEVPALDRRSPSTSFQVRGRRLTVDLLTPMRGRTSSRPVFLPSLEVHAQPVRFLDFLLPQAQPAVVVARAGIAVTVPAPARYVVHKLVTSRRRSPGFQTKALKDLEQAAQLIEVLGQDRPADLRAAWRDAAKQAPRFRQQLDAAVARLPGEVRAALDSVMRARAR